MAGEEVGVFVTVPSELEGVLDLAIIRASYLFAGVSVRKGEDGVIISGFAPSEAENIIKEFTYLLYREHIRQRFEPQRRRALERLHGASS